MFLSISAHALSLTETNARPGGSISAFCDPVTHTSTCQSSVRHSTTPRPLIASTTNTIGVFAAILPNAAMSLRTPVAVSLRVAKTAFASACCLIACSSCSGRTGSP